MAYENVNGVVRSPRRPTTTRPEWEFTHLAFDAARHGAAPAGTDVLLTQLGENLLMDLLATRNVLRGEWWPPVAASAASLGAHA
jgi:hypothetical protein